MKTHFSAVRLIILIAMLSVLSHSYLLWRFLSPADDKLKVFMTGANDGLEQMLPMQLYLYEKFKEGTWFYDTDFGLGGDFYTDLAYYYSTNIIHHINMIMVRVTEFFIEFDVASIDFWVYNAFFISILKTFFIIYFTYRFLKSIGSTTLPALIGGFIFAASPTYFRFTIFWSFFSDVFLWLPLTLWAIEVLIRKGRPGLFIFAVAATMINNFYFAYYQFIISFIYLMVRLIFSRKGDASRIDTLKRAIPSGLLGAGISCVAFFHAVRGFFNNDDREYEVTVPLVSELGWQDNIFYENYLIIILFLAIQALFTMKLYRHYFFRLFAVLTIVFMLFTLTPYVDTFFNGFQQPQKRWHYMLVFFQAALIALYLSKFRTIPLKQYLASLIPVYIIIALSVWLKGDIVIWVWMIPLIQLLGLLSSFKWRRRQFIHGVHISAIIVFVLMVAASHTESQIYHDGITDRNHLFYINSNHYASDLQEYNIDWIQQRKQPEQKIDYKVKEQDNTPLYMGFNGTSLYSSIIDGEIIDFYYNDLKVNIRYESISRYSTFQSRSNLFSLFNVDYMMRSKDHYGIPLKFSPIKDDGTYTVYENTLPLPFVRQVSRIYDPDELDDPLQRERAMLKGIVTDARPSNASEPSSENIMDQIEITAQNASYKNSILEVPSDDGGFIFDFSNIDVAEESDVYIEMSVELMEPIKRFTINVDGYPNERLFATSKYRTYADDLLYRIKLEDEIPISFPEGRYAVDIKGVYIEDYDVLEQQSEKQSPGYTVTEKKNSYVIELDDPGPGLIAVPMAFREGMTATGDASGRLDTFRANYLMTAFETGNDSIITISYTPPYYWTTLLISIISLIFSLLWLLVRKARRKDK